MGDLSRESYTLAEVESWARWQGYSLRHNHAVVTVCAEIDGGRLSF